jgi:hypothetical protein
MMSILKLEVKQLQSKNNIRISNRKNKLIKHLPKATHSIDRGKKLTAKLEKRWGGGICAE